MSNEEKKEEEKEKAFHSWDTARFHLNFPNGNQLSTIWGDGTYSDNHAEWLDRLMAGKLHLGEGKQHPVHDSNTVEIMFTCPDKLKKKILKKYGDGSGQPIGYLSLPKWLEIVNLLSK